MSGETTDVTSRFQRQGPQFLTLDPALHLIATNWPKGSALSIALAAVLAPLRTVARLYRKVPFRKRLISVEGERMSHHTQNDLLNKLGDTNLKLHASDDDFHNRKVLGPDGNEIGHVSALFLDRENGRSCFLQVGTGDFLGLGERAFLILVEDVTRTEPAEVHINHTCEQVLGEPRSDPKSITLRDQTFWAAYDRYYGYSPSRMKGG